MKNTFLLREEFKEWLIIFGKFPLPTVNSYLSYVGGVDKTFIIRKDGIEEETNLFEILKTQVKNGDDFEMDNTIISVINELYQKNIEIKLNTPLNTIRNWRSGLFQYREFLYYFIETKIEPIEEEKIFDEEGIEEIENENFEDYSFEDLESNGIVVLDLINDESDYSYSKTDLYKIFSFRIITQDRFYNHIFYPISFIKRFLYSKGEKQFIDNWVEKLLDNIDLHLEDGKIKLKEITDLNLTSEKVFVKHNNASKMVFTKLSDNKTFAPFEVKLLKKIAIDHEKPLLNVMSENIDELITFNEITIELKKYLSGTVNPNKLKKANNEVLQSDYVNHLNIANLKKELDFLSSKTSLQLMDSRENLIKKTIDNL